MLPVPLSVTAHQGASEKDRLTGTLKHRAAGETATASTNRIMGFIGITEVPAHVYFSFAPAYCALIKIKAYDA
jgi:hypothetical protein